jgi:hypothetical protein
LVVAKPLFGPCPNSSAIVARSTPRWRSDDAKWCRQSCHLDGLIFAARTASGNQCVYIQSFTSSICGATRPVPTHTCGYVQSAERIRVLRQRDAFAILCPRNGECLCHWIPRLSGSKITALMLGWVEDSVVRSDSRGSGVGGSFSSCAFALTGW